MKLCKFLNETLHRMERKSRSRDCCHHFAPENFAGRLLCPSQGQVMGDTKLSWIVHPPKRNGQYLNIIHTGCYVAWGWWNKNFDAKLILQKLWSTSLQCPKKGGSYFSNPLLQCPSQGPVTQKLWCNCTADPTKIMINFSTIPKKAGYILSQPSSAQAVMWSEVWSWQPPGDHYL